MSAGFSTEPALGQANFALKAGSRGAITFPGWDMLLLRCCKRLAWLNVKVVSALHAQCFTGGYCLTGGWCSTSDCSGATVAHMYAGDPREK